MPTTASRSGGAETFFDAVEASSSLHSGSGSGSLVHSGGNLVNSGSKLAMPGSGNGTAASGATNSNGGSGTGGGGLTYAAPVPLPDVPGSDGSEDLATFVLRIMPPKSPRCHALLWCCKPLLSRPLLWRCKALWPNQDVIHLLSAGRCSLMRVLQQMLTACMPEHSS
jgi:hypothetical protein